MQSLLIVGLLFTASFSQAQNHRLLSADDKPAVFQQQVPYLKLEPAAVNPFIKPIMPVSSSVSPVQQLLPDRMLVPTVKSGRQFLFANRGSATRVSVAVTDQMCILQPDSTFKSSMPIAYFATR